MHQSEFASFIYKKNQWKSQKKNSKLDRVSWTQCAVNGLKGLGSFGPLVSFDGQGSSGHPLSFKGLGSFRPPVLFKDKSQKTKVESQKLKVKRQNLKVKSWKSKGKIGDLAVSYRQATLITSRGVGVYGKKCNTVLFRGVEYKNYCVTVNCTAAHRNFSCSFQ